MYQFWIISFVLHFISFFFFFKQKTAYEMRISDWSSDVCSSDLQPRYRDHGPAGRLLQDRVQPAEIGNAVAGHCEGVDVVEEHLHDAVFQQPHLAVEQRRPHRVLLRRIGIPVLVDRVVGALRSEEPTCELQSIMRTTYAVFCFKKKQTNTHPQASIK